MGSGGQQAISLVVRMSIQSYSTSEYLGLTFRSRLTPASCWKAAVTQVVEFLSPMWKTSSAFPAPGYGPAQLSPALAVAGNCKVNQQMRALSVSLCQINKSEKK